MKKSNKGRKEQKEKTEEKEKTRKKGKKDKKEPKEPEAQAAMKRTQAGDCIHFRMFSEYKFHPIGIQIVFRNS